MGRLQYISTNDGSFNSVLAQNVTQDSVIEAKFLSTDYSNMVDFGVDYADIKLRHWYDTDDMYWYNGGGFQIASYWTLNEEHTVYFSTSEYKFDEHTFSVTGTCNIPSSPLYKSVVKGQLYYFKITDNGVDRVNLVGWEENGVVGLKDLVSGNFYQPSSGTWTAGPPYVPPTPSNQVPINKYKLGANNITKTYEGGTKINKMYVGNDLVYIALPTITGPQLQMPLNEVWYKTTNNNSMGLRSGTYYTDSNGNQLTYTESFDSVSGLWKMVFSDDVYGCQGPVYYNNDNRLVEVWYPYGYVKPNGMFAYGQTHLEKFKGDSPAIVDNGNAILCIVDCTVDGVNGKNFVMQAVTSGATTINIPEGALGVGPYTFFKATAITINLPSTITYVGNYCFERTNLTALNCYATTVPTTFSNIWYAVGNSGTLHYPAGSDYSSFPVPSGWTKVGDL